jgi:hypothetical protein
VGANRTRDAAPAVAPPARLRLAIYGSRPAAAAAEHVLPSAGRRGGAPAAAVLRRGAAAPRRARRRKGAAGGGSRATRPVPDGRYSAGFGEPGTIRGVRVLLGSR